MKPPYSVYFMHGLPTFDADQKATARIRQSLFPSLDRKPFKLEGLGMLAITGALEFEDYFQIRTQAESLLRDPTVEQVLLYINSPGGLASGAPETAAALARLNAEKPILGVGEGFVASAGFMLAAQATELVVAPSTLLGSVGVRLVLIDDSKLFEKLGVRVIPVSTGKDKNVGLEGVPVQDEDVATIQRLVDSFQTQFILSLKSSPFLNADKIVAMAENASVWLGAEAVRLGFASRTGTLEEVFARGGRLLAHASP